jgi:L-phenylalanine/L-methionine N-acetyltransferase
VPDPRTLVVRRVRRDDAAAIAATMSDPQVARGLLQMPHGSEDFWRKRIDEMPAGNAALDLMLVAERGGVVVGNAGLNGVAALRRRHVAGLGIAVASSAQGQGIGSALMAGLIDWADRWAQLLRIELTVFSDNAAAIALYRKFGFEHEGTHRAYALRDGVYADVHAMARLHPSPPVLR